MAIGLDAITDYIYSTTGLPNPSGCTALFWFYLAADRDVGAAVWVITDYVDESLYIDLGPTGTLLRIDEYYGGSGHYTDGSDLSTGVWYCIAMVCNGSTNTLYLGSESSAMAQVAQGTHGFSFTSAVMQMASDTAFWANCRLAGFRAWDAALNLTELEAERTNGSAAYRSANLNRCTPLTNSSTLTDTSGHGYTWSSAGSLTDQTDPAYPAAAGLKLPVALATYRRMRA